MGLRWVLMTHLYKNKEDNACKGYLIYRTLLKRVLPQSQVYLAISREVYKSFFRQKAIQTILKENQIYLIIVSLQNEEIIQWIN